MSFRELELHLLKGLQEYHNVQDVLYTVTKLADPRTVLNILIPLTYWFVSPRFARRAFGAVILSDYVNAMLKFPLAGDRPYWVDGTLLQTPLSCETGYGNPSGHTQVSTTFWWGLMLAVPLLPLRVIGALSLLAAGTSRLFISAHFPHQIVLGFLVGVSVYQLFPHAVVCFLNLVARYLHLGPILKAAKTELLQTLENPKELQSNEPMIRSPDQWSEHRSILRSFWEYITCKEAVIVSSLVAVLLISYAWFQNWFTLSILGMDPFRSIRLATEGCHFSTKSTTRPMEGVLRDVGCAMAWILLLFVPEVYERTSKGWKSAGIKVLMCVVAPALVFDHMLPTGRSWPYAILLAWSAFTHLVRALWSLGLGPVLAVGMLGSVRSSSV